MNTALATSLRTAVLALSGLTALCAASFAADNKAPGADARYQKQVAYCNSGQSQQDKTTCLKEAGAARDEARRGRLADGSGTSYDGNALARCNAQPAADREACVQRIQGSGVTTTQGSVKGGGVIRETVTPVPAK